MDLLTVRPLFLLDKAKRTAARDYGPPRRPHVIEPFAGSGGYAVYREPPRVTLVGRDPLIVALWRWLPVEITADVRGQPPWFTFAYSPKSPQKMA
jgi:hypothetical protein